MLETSELIFGQIGRRVVFAEGRETQLQHEGHYLHEIKGVDATIGHGCNVIGEEVPDLRFRIQQKKLESLG